MNAQPHTHELKIRDNGSYWAITYGDQTDTPDKLDLLHPDTWFKPPAYLLEKKVREIIAKHDRESLQAGERESTVDSVYEKLMVKSQPVSDNWLLMIQPKYKFPNRDKWGSDQM